MATPVDKMDNKSVQGELNPLVSKAITTSTLGGAGLPLIVIVGPTSSGKSSLAMRVAKQYRGEIISADSRSVYKGMDIGTAKPTAKDQSEVPHWGLDLVEPGDKFTAADFKDYANKKVSEIRQRGNLPLIVGGTGLYVDGVIFDYEFGKPQPEVRQMLEAMTLPELKDYCANNNIELPENDKNRRYVIRAIELKNVESKRLSAPIANTLIVGITTNRDILRQRITDRAAQMFDSGMIEEAQKLGKKYGWKSEAMTGNIYPLVRQFIAGGLNEKELQEKFITSDWRLAKRQLTWLKRNPYINWLELNDAYDFIASKLNG